MRKVLAILALLIAGIEALAQDSKVALPFLALDRSAVASSMGGAYLASASAHGIFSNPAASCFGDGRGDISLDCLLPGGAKTGYLNLGGGMHLGCLYFTAGASYGIGQAYESMSSMESEAVKYRTGDLMAGAGIAVQTCEFLAVGANLYYAGQFLSPYSHPGAFSCDLFLTGRYGNLTATLAANRLGTALRSLNEDGKTFRLPSAIALGLGYAFVVKDGHALEFLTDAGYYLHKDFYISAGACYKLMDMVSFRAGFHYGRFVPTYGSAGIGISFKDIDINAAITTGGNIESTGASLSLGYRF